MSPDEQSLLQLQFPCDFPIKVMGHQADDFAQFVFDLIARHTADLDYDQLSTRASSNRRYLSVTVTIRATSRAQLDAIYQELSDHSRVLMAL